MRTKQPTEKQIRSFIFGWLWVEKNILSNAKPKFTIAKNNCDKWMRYENDIARHYYPQLLDWIKSIPRKPSNLAFTSGLGRNIARLIEISEEEKKVD